MSRTLLTVMFAWSGFYMIGAMALMILPEYEAIMQIDYAQTSLLLGVLGVGVAAGSVVTGLVSGQRIRPQLIPCGAFGMAASFLVLGAIAPAFLPVAILVLLAGFSAGFYIIPLQSLLQYLSPPRNRGRFLGTANAMSFLLASVGAAFYWLLTGLLAVNPHRVFLICGALAAVGSVFGALELRRILRLVAAENNNNNTSPSPSRLTHPSRLNASPNTVGPNTVSPNTVSPNTVSPNTAAPDAAAADNAAPDAV